MKNLLLPLTSFLLLSPDSPAQDTIPIQNPSFETAASKCGEMPEAWINRGNKEETAPSVQPGCLEVSKPAYHGRRHISLVTRKNGNCDIIGQKLPENTRLHKDSTYHLQLQLAYSETLEMPKKNRKRSESYGQSAILQIWGVNSQSGEDELLAETQPIRHTSWQGYDLVFRPGKEEYDEIQFQAAFSRESHSDYNGNVLIDSISAIMQPANVPLLGQNGSGFNPGSEISLTNPSFEDVPRCCEAPRGWNYCGPPDESPPDVQPGSFQVTKPAHSGDTYLSLVVRDNDTWEGVGQRLPTPLQVGQTYIFEAQLARAELFLSLSRTTGREVNYTTPVKLRIWGGSEFCDHAELLAESPLITTTQWNNYQFEMTPRKGAYLYLTLEAYYKERKWFSYNGNLLVDTISLFTALK